MERHAGARVRVALLLTECKCAVRGLGLAGWTGRRVELLRQLLRRAGCSRRSMGPVWLVNGLNWWDCELRSGSSGK